MAGDSRSPVLSLVALGVDSAEVMKMALCVHQQNLRMDFKQKIKERGI